MILARSRALPLRRSPRRGVSLVELLVVLAIMLLIFAMAGVLVGPPLRKARLASAANDLSVLARRVAVEARTQRGGQGAFVFLKATPSTGTFELVADNNGDGVFQEPPALWNPAVDSLIRGIPPFQLPAGIVFTNLPAPYDSCWSNWSVPNATAFVLGIDFQGRTVGNTGRQITGIASVNLSHADMVSGAVTPFIVHRLTFGPVWNVRQTRLVRDAAAPTGWREF